MTLMFDARVPVVFGSRRDAQDGDAVLAIEADGGPRHDPGCACCAARTPAAPARGRVFAQRARGAVGFFRRVRAEGQAGVAAVRAALLSDPVAAARFRLA